jgi:ABC-type Mn/Zn transport systems, ATPase component
MKPAGNIDAIKSARGGDSAEESLPLVSLENVSLGYDSTPVVKDVNLAIYPGSLIGLA